MFHGQLTNSRNNIFFLCCYSLCYLTYRGLFIMKTIILMLFLFNVSGVFAEVDEDCLCIPYPYTSYNLHADAVDTCKMRDMYDLDFINVNDCDDIFDKYFGYLNNTYEEGYTYTKRGLSIAVYKNITEGLNINNGDYFGINEIKDTYKEIKEKLMIIQDSIGLFRMKLIYNFQNFVPINLEFEDYQQYKKIINLLENNLSPEIKVGDITSFQIPQSGIENENENPNISINGNVLISGKEAIESVTAYDLYGREIEKYENINSNNLNLSGLKGAFILQVKTNNTTHTIKYFNN